VLQNAAVPKPLSLFQKLFPLFQKYITGVISQELAGERCGGGPTLSTANPVPIGVGNRQKKMANRLSKRSLPKPAMTKKAERVRSERSWLDWRDGTGLCVTIRANRSE